MSPVCNVDLNGLGNFQTMIVNDIKPVVIVNDVDDNDHDDDYETTNSDKKAIGDSKPTMKFIFKNITADEEETKQKNLAIPIATELYIPYATVL